MTTGRIREASTSKIVTCTAALFWVGREMRSTFGRSQSDVRIETIDSDGQSQVSIQ